MLFGLGHAMYVVFDCWLPWDMPWPIYRTYSTLMGWSDDVQGGGRGPWRDAPPQDPS